MSSAPDWTGYTPFATGMGSDYGSFGGSGGSAGPVDLGSNSFGSNSMDFSGMSDLLNSGNADPNVWNTDGINFGGASKTGGLFGGGGALGTGMNGFQLGGDILGGLKTLGGLYMGIRQLGLANKQFKLSRDFANANLTNQTKAYNTNLADREASRASFTGMSPQQAQAYVSSNSLSAPHLG